ncbi:MAG: hypothetical protein WED34_12440 [Planctomycetales bacterium]
MVRQLAGFAAVAVLLGGASVPSADAGHHSRRNQCCQPVVYQASYGQGGACCQPAVYQGGFQQGGCQPVSRCQPVSHCQPVGGCAPAPVCCQPVVRNCCAPVVQAGCCAPAVGGGFGGGAYDVQPPVEDAPPPPVDETAPAPTADGKSA